MTGAPALERERNLEIVRQNIAKYVARRNQEWADDIAQDALLVLHEKYPYLTALADLMPVGITTARNKLFEYQRRRGREAQLDERFDASDTRSRTVDEKLLQQSAAERLRDGISQLGDDCQRLLRMLLAGKSTADMKAILGVSDGAYYTRLCRCRQKLAGVMGWQA